MQSGEFNHVYSFVFNNCTNDARVLKEAKTLVENGYELTIYAIKDQNTPYEESRNGFTIIRIDRNPVHLRLIRKIRKLLRESFLGKKRELKYTQKKLNFSKTG